MRASLLPVVLLGVLALGACQASVEATGVGEVDEPDTAAPAGPGSSPRIKGNGGQSTLPAGTLHGPLMIKGNGNTVQGAGPGQTIIEGDLMVKGNGNTVRGVTVTGAVLVKGNGNDVTGVDAKSTVDVKGDANKR